MEGIKVGESVLVDVNGEKLPGVVRSIQLGKNLADVQIYKKGHVQHCRILAFPPDQVTHPDGTEIEQPAPEIESHLQARFDAIERRLAALESKAVESAKGDQAQNQRLDEIEKEPEPEKSHKAGRGH